MGNYAHRGETERRHAIQKSLISVPTICFHDAAIKGALKFPVKYRCQKYLDGVYLNLHSSEKPQTENISRESVGHGIGGVTLLFHFAAVEHFDLIVSRARAE